MINKKLLVPLINYWGKKSQFQKIKKLENKIFYRLDHQQNIYYIVSKDILKIEKLFRKSKGAFMNRDWVNKEEFICKYVRLQYKNKPGTLSRSGNIEFCFYFVYKP